MREGSGCCGAVGGQVRKQAVKQLALVAKDAKDSEVGPPLAFPGRWPSGSLAGAAEWRWRGGRRGGATAWE